jgi:hypothetical protein
VYGVIVAAEGDEGEEVGFRDCLGRDGKFLADDKILEEPTFAHDDALQD